jgi:LPXTG-motif cell wall-anchored protein
VVVTAKIVGGAPEDLVNRAFISPASDDVEESNPLSVPDGGTDTDESGTNNDSMVVLHLSEERDPSTPAVPAETPKRLAFTGSQQAAVVVVGGLLLVAGACLVRLRRRRPAAL